jgi:integrase
MHPDRVTKLFDIHQTAIRAAQLKADPKAETLPRIRLHDVRHTYATLGLLEGVHPKVMSERLGHANVMITLDTYSHVLSGMQESAAELIEACIDA